MSAYRVPGAPGEPLSGKSEAAPVQNKPVRWECTDDHILDGHHIHSEFYVTRDGNVGRRCLRCPPKVRPSMFGELELDE